MFTSVCDVKIDIFSCSVEPSPSQTSERSMSEVSDTGENDEEEEEAPKPKEKRQYVGALNLLFLGY